MTTAPPTAGGTELLSYRAYRGKPHGPFAAAWAVQAGTNRLVSDAQYAPDRPDAPDPAP